MDRSTIAVLTGKSTDEILRSGGSGSWVLSPRNARRARYLVCVRNDDNHHASADEAHGTAFLVGTICGLAELAPRNGLKRWRILISEYATLDMPDVWKGWRNPVRYTDLSELGIDIDKVALQPLEQPPTAAPAADEQPETAVQRGLTIAQAKRELAETFGVRPDAIEIIIRG